MAEIKELFADTIREIHFSGDMVRVDFGTLQPPEAEGSEPVLESSFRVIMPPAGLLTAMGSMQQLIDKLAAAGVFHKERIAAPPADPSAESGREA